MRFFKCKHCNEFIFSKRNVDLSKADTRLEEIIPNTMDASKEKHIPLYELNGRNLKVLVGSVTHPMEIKHFIEWILLETNKGFYKIDLDNNKEPTHTFVLNENEEMIKIYSYCNLHGLWSN